MDNPKLSPEDARCKLSSDGQHGNQTVELNTALGQYRKVKAEYKPVLVGWTIGLLILLSELNEVAGSDAWSVAVMMCASTFFFFVMMFMRWRESVSLNCESWDRFVSSFWIDVTRKTEPKGRAFSRDYQQDYYWREQFKGNALTALSGILFFGDRARFWMAGLTVMSMLPIAVGSALLGGLPDSWMMYAGTAAWTFPTLWQIARVTLISIQLVKVEKDLKCNAEQVIWAEWFEKSRPETAIRVTLHDIDTPERKAEKREAEMGGSLAGDLAAEQC